MTTAVTATRPARASIVERIVAVVGDRPILLSDLRHRARPFLFRIIVSTPNPAQQAAAETEMMRDLLNRMIDDRLEEQAADKARIVVTAEEIDTAIKNVAGQAHVRPSDLVAEAKRQGLSEQDYRDEIRRQLLEGKLVQLRVRGRVRVTEQDARAAYAHWLKDMNEQQPVELRILALRLGEGVTDEQIRAREVLSQDIVTRARGGEDFCKLVIAYSDDNRTKATCGSSGPQAMGALLAPLQEYARTLKEGEVGDPVRIGQQAILVVQGGGRPKIPPYEQIKDQMTERAFGEAMERQRKLWLDELRRGVFLEVRF
jgi:peptidyl-prolyl cis-trans isomerase SurA